MSAATPTVGINNPIVTRQRKKRDLETTMTTLKQLLEPSMKKGSRKKNKPRSIVKKVIPPKKVSRFENVDDGEYYPNKLKRKVRMKKTVLRPKHDLKVVVATNKRKRHTPHKGLDPSVPIDSEQNTKGSSNKLDTNNSSIHLHVQTTPGNSTNNTEHSYVNTECSTQNSMYKLISPPHKSLTQLTVDDLIRMDEDSLSGEDMMEILTCPSPVWWEDPADVALGTVFLTQSSEVSTVIEHSDNTRQERVGLKRGTICVSASKAKKIAKLENILGHIKSLVRDDVRGESNKNNDNIINKTNNKDINDSINKVDNVSVIHKATDRVNEGEVNETEKRRKISSSGSEISVNEDELLRDLENIDIPIENKKATDSRNVNDKEDTKNCDDVPIDIEGIDDLNDNEKEPKNITFETQNKTKLKKTDKKKAIQKKIESPVAKKQMNKDEQYDNDKNKKETKNNVSKPNDKDRPEHKSEGLEKQNDDVLDVRLIKVPTNVTNEVKVWSTLEDFKRHNFTPSDFQSTINIDEYEIPHTNKEKDALEVNNEAILIDDDSNDFDVVNIMNERTHVTISPSVTDETSCNSEIIELDSAKDIIECSEEIVGREKSDNNEINIIKEDTIRTGNDLVIKLIETDVQDKTKLPKEQNEIIKSTHVTISPVTDVTSCNSEIMELDSAKDIIECSEEIIGKEKSDNEVNIIKEDTIRIGNDLDIKLIETDVQDKTKLPKEQNEISKIKSNMTKHTESIKLATAPLKATDWHVSNYLKFDNKSNGRGIFRVEETDDANDTILCLNDVDVSLVKNPRLDKTTVKVNDSISDLSITLVNKCSKGTELTKLTESPKSISTSESTVENSDTISDTNIQFLDEYEDNINVNKKDKSDKHVIDKTKLDRNITDEGNIIDLESEQETINVD